MRLTLWIFAFVFLGLMTSLGLSEFAKMNDVKVSVDFAVGEDAVRYTDIERLTLIEKMTDHRDRAVIFSSAAVLIFLGLSWMASIAKTSEVLRSALENDIRTTTRKLSTKK